jgi:hypothetical protein
MTPEPDYPAAHSMDTTWYAVDQDGHVALFDSGEAGAVPEAHTEEETDREDLAKALPVAPYRLLDWMGESREETHVDLPDRKSASAMGPTLLFLNNLKLIADDVNQWGVEQAPASEGVAVLFHDLPIETAWRLHEAGACFGCFAWPFQPREYGLSYDLRCDLPGRMGLFLYEHETDNWISGPYGRAVIPERPLKLDDLPVEIRERIGRFRFIALRFCEAEKIQPVDHGPCSSWESAYLDLDGRTIRPIPGREDDFNAEDWANSSEFRVEVPRQPPPG